MTTRDVLHPTEDRLVVLPHKAEERTAGGIILPDQAQEKPLRGTVLAVGPGRWTVTDTTIGYVRDDEDVKPGDTVLFGRFGGTQVNVNGEELLILTPRDVLAIITTNEQE